MKKNVNLILYLMFGLYSIQLTSQEFKPPIEAEDLAEKSNFELVISGVYVYTPESGNFSPSTEVLLTYWIADKWGFGTGYSMVFENEGRVGHEILAVASHKPWRFLTVNLGPSFSLANSEKDFEVSGYLEGEFNINVGEIQIGPVIGILIGEEFRVFGGFHIGFEF